MRHRINRRRLSRTSEHRLAMRRNLVASLFEHETISTTIEKAKDVKSFAEKLITLAKKGTLSARRRAIALLGNRDIINYEDERPVKKGTIIGKLFSEIGPRYLDRPGGYTRIIRLSLSRLGDNGSLVLLQLVGKDEGLKKKTKAAVEKGAGEKGETEQPSDMEQVPEAEVVTEAEEQKEAGETAEAEESTKPEDAGEAEETSEAKKNQAEETAEEGKQADEQ